MSKIRAALLGGLAAGALDQASAFASFVPHGSTEIGILQYVASGLIGNRAFSGGGATALLGLGVHVSLTTAMAGIFVLTATKWPALLRRPWYSGLVYGLLVYFVMTYVAVPLSGAPNWKPAEGWAMVGGLLAHCFYVGVPIAFIARAFLLDL